MATKYHVQHVKSNLKNSEANGPKLPTSEQIEFGEIAINYLKDYETISIKNSEQKIVTFSSDASVNKKLETKADKARVDEIDEVVSKAFDAMNKSCGFSEEVVYTPQNELIRDCVSLSEAMEIVAEKANSGTGSGISDAPSDGKKYVRQDAKWVEETKIDTDTFATKEDLSSKADASALAQKQDTLVSGSNIKTVNGESILGSGDITVVKSKIMTQQEYDELGDKDNNTVYFIVG